LRGASAEREFQCKKIVALCTGVPVDKVEEVSRFLSPSLLFFCCGVALAERRLVRCSMI